MKRILMKIYKVMIKIIKILNRDRYNSVYINYLKKLGVRIDGKPRFISDDVWCDPEGYEKINIGDKCTISKGVTLLVHDYSLTQCMYLRDSSIIGVRKIDNISIGEGSFIGANTTILPGTYIGNNVIVAAGSVVSGVLESNYIYGGVPAKKIESIEEFYNKIIIRDKDKITIWKEYDK